jgi:hypothetical protein
VPHCGLEVEDPTSTYFVLVEIVFSIQQVVVVVFETLLGVGILPSMGIDE